MASQSARASASSRIPSFFKMDVEARIDSPARAWPADGRRLASAANRRAHAEAAHRGSDDRERGGRVRPAAGSGAELPSRRPRLHRAALSGRTIHRRRPLRRRSHRAPIRRLPHRSDRPHSDRPSASGKRTRSAPRTAGAVGSRAGNPQPGQQPAPEDVARGGGAQRRSKRSSTRRPRTARATCWCCTFWWTPATRWAPTSSTACARGWRAWWRPSPAAKYFCASSPTSRNRALVRARVRIPVENLAVKGFAGAEVRDGIVLANDLALVDPYRAATHNKGIMNGVDAIAIATEQRLPRHRSGCARLCRTRRPLPRAHALDCRRKRRPSRRNRDADESGHGRRLAGDQPHGCA